MSVVLRRLVLCLLACGGPIVPAALLAQTPDITITKPPEVAAAPQTGGLDWQIERSFRFFRYASDEAVQRIAYDLIAQHGDPSPEAIEKLLNGGDFWQHALPAPEARPKTWPSDWRLPSARTPFDIVAALRRAEHRSIPDVGNLDQRGWASLLDLGLDAQRAGICWNRDRRLHDNCKEHGDYVHPEYWTIRLFGAADDVVSGPCVWTIEGGSFVPPSGKERAASGTTAGGCAEQIAYAWAAPGTDRVEGHARVTRTDATGKTVEIVAAPVDRLIVGMGDSMTSGEGNPEVPATFDQRYSIAPTFLPRAAPPGAASWAQWSDRRCHRSVYSWQTRAALQLALQDRKQSVTMLPYGCSGAEIVEGLLYPYAGVEDTRPATASRGQSAQVAEAYQELCSAYEPPAAQPYVPPREQDDALSDDGPAGDPAAVRADALRDMARCRADGSGGFRRKVDLLFLEIGINDSGFARWAAGAMTQAGSQARSASHGFIPDMGSDAECGESCALTRRLRERLAGRFAALRRVLDERFLPAAGLTPERVLVAQYPSEIQGADGKTCPAGNLGMTSAVFPAAAALLPLHLPFLPARHSETDIRKCRGDIFGGGVSSAWGAVFAIRRPADLEAIDRFRADELNGAIRTFAGEAPAAFTTLSDYLERFEARGFCATTDPDSENRPVPEACWSLTDVSAAVHPFACGDDQSCILQSAESLHIPRPYSSGDPEGAGSWRPFRPTDYFGYRPRTRLFRTPNDAFMLVNKRSANETDANPLGALDLRDRFSSGAFHPSAEAHAIVATAMARVAAQKIAGEQPAAPPPPP